MADETPKGDKPNQNAIVVFQSITGIITTVIETFGWTGALLIFAFAFVVWYATDDQKHRIIEMYVLGQGISQQWMVIVLSVTFALTAIAQNRWYKNKLKEFTKELEREGVEKGKLQETKINKKLQHAKSKTKIEGK